jgi:hypothetical protein
MALLITYVLIALVISFLCSLLEASLLTITPSAINSAEQRGAKWAGRMKEFKSDIDRPLSAILTLNTVAHTMGAAGAGAQYARVFGNTGEAIFAGVLTLAILVFSEIIPKTLGSRLAVQLAASDGGMGITPARADYPGTDDPAAWSAAQPAPQSNPAAAAFRAEIAPVPAKGLRTLVLQDHAGAPVRVVDAGPRDGRPVIILHPQIFPLIGPADAAPLFRHQIRALWPIRQGALVPDGSAQGSSQSLADQIASTQRAVIAFSSADISSRRKGSAMDFCLPA